MFPRSLVFFIAAMALDVILKSVKSSKEAKKDRKKRLEELEERGEGVLEPEPVAKSKGGGMQAWLEQLKEIERRVREESAQHIDPKPVEEQPSVGEAQDIGDIFKADMPMDAAGEPMMERRIGDFAMGPRDGEIGSKGTEIKSRMNTEMKSRLKDHRSDRPMRMDDAIEDRMERRSKVCCKKHLKEDLLRGIIFTEILSKPKALNRERRI